MAQYDHKGDRIEKIDQTGDTVKTLAFLAIVSIGIAFYFLTGSETAPVRNTTVETPHVTVPEMAGTVPIEKDAVISEVRYSRSDMITLIEHMTKMIKNTGWRCDSISSASPWLRSTGFTLNCNGYKYKYEIADRGGNWVVTLK